MERSNGSKTATSEHYHVCLLCEAGCGLAVTMDEGRPVSVRPNPKDVTSNGYICPKGAHLLGIEGDPDRLSTPLRRTADGGFEAVSWAQAFDDIAERLGSIQRSHGKDAVAVYMGTVFAHKYSTLLVLNALRQALGTRNWMGVASLDSSARFAAAHLLYGSTMSISVPDLDRTDYLLCIGANPVVSNGSMMTAPNAKGRLRALRQRGGKLVVVDPRRSETAAIADEHISIRPGTDAALVLAMAHYLVHHDRVDRRDLGRHTRGLDDIVAALDPFTPDAVEPFAGLPAGTIARLATEFADAPTSVAYSRMGPSTARYATLACYAVELLNIVAGRLGRVGGAMFATPAVDVARLARLTGADGRGRYTSRVRGLPETVGELPSVVLAEEIETPGDGQVRALITCAGNPVRAVPNGTRIDRALAELDFMVSIDVYVNETTRHADYILPPASTLAEDHVDFFFANMAVHDAVRWSQPALAPGPEQRLDWQIVLELAERMGGGIMAMRPLDALLRALRIRITPAHLAGWALRMGPYGDHFLPWSKGLNPRKLQAAPHGVDLGPLKPGVRRRVYHRGRRIQLAPALIVEQMRALAGELAPAPSDELLLIGRRHLKASNSWLHNVAPLASKRERCELLVHPSDAERLGIADGGPAILESRVHRGPVDVRVSADIRPGVVSLPHGFGHAALGERQRVAARRGGVSANDWTDDAEVDSIAGQSVLNGVPVRLSPIAG
ncbi:molybdopterin-dependent oxidoreductase [Haliangium sp.]|uniref:molybdopterin-dependent oxidoreductase n=1 Tax=Haliangium sp. TaxID=2663208 RepID=UPI003D0B65DE